MAWVSSSNCDSCQILGPTSLSVCESYLPVQLQSLILSCIGKCTQGIEKETICQGSGVSKHGSSDNMCHKKTLLDKAITECPKIALVRYRLPCYRCMALDDFLQMSHVL